MKDYVSFEKQLLNSADGVKRGLVTIINNMGKAVAIIAAAVAVLTTFTEVTFADIYTGSFIPSFAVVIVCSYIMYFSLEDAGEELGRGSEEYVSAEMKYRSERDKISGEDIEPLRAFCRQYSSEELKFRKEGAMMAYEVSPSDIENYRAGSAMSRKKRRAIARILSLKPIPLTPSVLLSRGRYSGKSELSNPERKKIPMLLLKILPSTVCMTVTVSVMMSFKENMTASDIVSGILSSRHCR
jgi:hypothetical protein